MRLTELAADLEALRADLAEELLAINRYESQTFSLADEDAREAHLSGQVAAGLKEKAPELLAEEPTIERIDVLAGKVDIPALTAAK